MADNETPQIVAPDSPLPDQLASGFRALVLTVTAFALGRHWIEGDVATLVTALLGIGLPIVLAQMKARHRANQLGNLARDPRVPDRIITTEGRVQ